MQFKLRRWAKAEGKTVVWGNMVGPCAGQSGKYEFASKADAKRFAEHASSDPTPSLADEDLNEAGVPLPVMRSDS